MGKGFEELEVWQLARELSLRIYQLTSIFPDCEKYGLSSQLRRASVSVMSNIAEGWGRHSEASFANFLDQAQGSLCEIQSQLFVALDQNFIAENLFEDLRDLVQKLGAKIYSFIRRLRPNVVREVSAIYGTADDIPHLKSDIQPT